MQIKTITCHQVYNHGASLQEYALLFFLNSNGFEAKTIRYKPPYLSNHFNFLFINNPKFDKFLLKQLYLLAKLPGRIRGLRHKRVFDNFSKKHIPGDKIKYRSNEELVKNLPLADAYICGSDQIWNSIYENGKDPAFFLDFVPLHKLKISYAASFATDTIADDIKDFVKEKVSRIDHISVRETSALEILKDLDILNAIQVLDPVFLLEREHWNKFLITFDEPFIFVYDFENNPNLKRIALEYKANKNVKIYTINKDITYADRNFYGQGPETFLSLMNSANFIFTNSFHSVAFALIFEKQFVTFNRIEAINTRSRDLLNLLHLDNLTDDYITVENLVKIDYIQVRKKLSIEINKAKSFLLSIKKYK